MPKRDLGAIPPPAWEIFDECPDCFTPAKEPCYNLKSTSMSLIECKVAHKRRRMLNDY